jgi:hypothetical protein
LANALAALGPSNAPTRLDLESMFIVHRGNLAVMHEAQAMMADAGQEVVRIQCRHLEAMLAEAGRVEIATPGEAVARAIAAAGRACVVAATVAGLSLDVVERVGDLLMRRARTNLDDLLSLGV